MHGKIHGIKPIRFYNAKLIIAGRYKYDLRGKTNLSLSTGTVFILSRNNDFDRAADL